MSDDTIKIELSKEEMIADLELTALLTKVMGGMPLSPEEVKMVEIWAKIKASFRKKEDPSIAAKFKRIADEKKKIPAKDLAKALEFKREKASNGSENQE